MCRRNLVLAAALIAFGCGIILSLVVDPVWIRICLGSLTIALGIGLLRGNC